MLVTSALSSPTPPDIDNLACNGMKFTQFYSAYPICTPSRSGLLTGKKESCSLCSFSLWVCIASFQAACDLGMRLNLLITCMNPTNSWLTINSYQFLLVYQQASLVPRTVVRPGNKSTNKHAKRDIAETSACRHRTRLIACEVDIFFFRETNHDPHDQLCGHAHPTIWETTLSSLLIFRNTPYLMEVELMIFDNIIST